MNPRWSFPDLEFVVRWQRLREDTLPHPFVFTTDIAYEDDFQRARTAVLDRVVADPDPELDAALADIARPDIAIRVRGVDGVDPANPAASIRLLAARRESRGYLLTQFPGRTIDHSGGFTIAECEAVRLADAVADALPPVGAGSYRGFALPDPGECDPVDDYAVTTRLWDGYDDPPEVRARQFAAIVPERIGVIDVAQGMSRFGPKGRLVRSLQWRDLPGDGRHVIAAGPPATVTGADRAGVITAINDELITVIRAIKDERS